MWQDWLHYPVKKDQVTLEVHLRITGIWSNKKCSPELPGVSQGRLWIGEGKQKRRQRTWAMDNLLLTSAPWLLPYSTSATEGSVPGQRNLFPTARESVMEKEKLQNL